MRLGGPNFHEIPINRPIAPVHNNQRDGHMRQTINRGKRQLRAELARRRLSVAGARGGRAASSTFRRADRRARRCARAAEKFFDHFSQATLFFNSQSRAGAGSHRRGACASSSARSSGCRSASAWSACSRRSTPGSPRGSPRGSASTVPELELPLNQSIPADGDVAAHSAPRRSAARRRSLPPSRWRIRRKDRSPPGRSRFWRPTGSMALRWTRFEIRSSPPAPVGFDRRAPPRNASDAGGDDRRDRPQPADHHPPCSSTPSMCPEALRAWALCSRNVTPSTSSAEAYRHCKPLGASSEGVRLLRSVPGVLPPAEERRGAKKGNGGSLAAEGIIVSDGAADGHFAREFLAALGEHRFWTRSRRNRMGAAEGADETRGRPPLVPPPTRGERRV